jgi:hypothetical protein
MLQKPPQSSASQLFVNLTPDFHLWQLLTHPTLTLCTPFTAICWASRDAEINTILDCLGQKMLRLDIEK